MSATHAEPQVDRRLETALTWVLLTLVVVINVVIAVRVSRIEAETLTTEIKTLALIFMFLPPPLCFVLVRTFTQMMEDERVKVLSEAWARCQIGYQTSPQFEQARTDAEKSSAHEQRDILFNGMRSSLLQRFPALAEFFLLVRNAPAKGDAGQLPSETEMGIARRLARMELRMAGLNRGAYNLPLLFFTFAYLGGLSLVFPQLEYYGSIPPSDVDIYLSETVTIPLVIVQVGFFGGAAYAAYNIISRFLSQDIAPRLFLVAGVRLVLAPVGAVVLYWSPEILPGALKPRLVLYFVAGGFPFSFLKTVAEWVLSRFEVWKHVAFFAERAKLTEGEIASTLAADPAATAFAPRERLLLRLVDELHDTARVSDGLWQALRAEWSEPQLIELIALAGLYHMVSFVTNALRVPLESYAARFSRYTDCR